MTLRRYLIPLTETLVALMLFLYVTAYGGNADGLAAFHGALSLVWNTMLNKDIHAEYYGIVPSTFWYSIRLILVAIVFAVIGAVLFTVLRTRLKARKGRLVETAIALFESIPEPMYVILVVILTLYLIENYGINIPVFIDGPPNWLDTVIPGIALALPAAFYLSKVLTLRLFDELDAPYVITALSKGSSQRRVFYRHILANVVPFLLRHLPVVSTLVISSEMFAEFLLEYQGAYYNFPIYGLGWAPKPKGVASYEAGYILVLGVVLILLWSLVRFLSQTGVDTLYQQDVETIPWPRQRRVLWSWVATGAIIIGIVVICSMFPHLVTDNSPTQRHLANVNNGLGAPFKPNGQFPLGTDMLGRGLLARTLQGTWNTLWPALMCTGLIFVLSLLLSSLAISRPTGTLARTIRFLGTALSALPVFLVLLVALHPRPTMDHQEFLFLTWVVLLEVGRSCYNFVVAYEEWFQFNFVQGAISLGRSRIRILYTHLLSWLTSFSIEYAFSEFTRILALMTMLAIFKIYAISGMVWDPLQSTTHKVLGSLQNSWFSMIGDPILSGSYISYSYFLYAPAIALLLIMIGSNIIARGLRGASI